MVASVNVQRLSNDVVALATEILGMRESLKERERAEFLHAGSQRRARIAAALQLDEGEVAALVAASDLAQENSDRGLPVAQVWDYDTTRATVEDLTWRRDLLRNRLRVLHYLQVH